MSGVRAEPGDGASDVTDDVVPPDQRNLTASTTGSPGKTETDEGVFTEPVWYGVQFWLDGERPEDKAGTTRFNPTAANGGTWEILAGHIYESGEFSWEVRSTDNPGQFDQ